VRWAILRKGSMFADVPERLVIFVRDWIKQSDRNLLYLEAAGGVIREYIEKSVFSTDVDKFFSARIVNQQGEYHATYPLNVIRLAETLFIIRRCEGFSCLCDRFKSRDLRSTFFEASVARMFAVAGFSPQFRPEIGEIEKDFDFTATNGNEIINIEVTALTARRFSYNTIKTALNRKREQLPRDNPAAIFCIIPELWSKQQIDLNAEIERSAKRFFGSTSRVNVLVFMQERHLDVSGEGSRGALVVIRKPFKKMSPRYPTEALDFLFSGLDMSNEARAILEKRVVSMSDATDIEMLNKIVDEFRTSEFFRWVDHLHPR
jgi:hypothetical protein